MKPKPKRKKQAAPKHLGDGLYMDSYGHIYRFRQQKFFFGT
jgi:hypothetical protein